VYQLLIDNPAMRDTPISKVMQAPFPVVKGTAKLDEAARLINEHTPAVLVELEDGKKHILTRQDIIACLS
jgi:cystathionine beta-synthase